MTATNIPKQKPTWPMLMLGAGLIAAVLALAALYNMVYLEQEALIRSYSQRLNALPRETQQEQVIYAAPAESVNLGIQAQKSIKGLWSAKAFSVLVTDGDTGATRAEALISQEKTWDSKIQHNAIFERRDVIFIPASFTLSPDARVGEELTGKLEGEIVYPIISEGGDQADVASNVSVPFAVKVVSAVEIAEKVRAQASTTLSIAGPIALILIVIPLAYFRKNRKSKQAAQTGNRTARN